MRRIPIAVKLGITTLVAGSMSYLLYNDQLYDEETYRVALKFRDKYEEVKNEKEAF